MEKILVSACLIGTNCRYDGRSNLITEIEELKKHFEIVSLCPEVAGGLSIPRVPCERVKDKIISKNGIDCSEQYLKGANLAVKLIKQYNIKYALLKSNSPSCGNNYIYDGTFTRTLIEGQGLTAEMLNKNNVEVFNEVQIEELIKRYTKN